jgi:hypothetical protein
MLLQEYSSIDKLIPQNDPKNKFLVNPRGSPIKNTIKR